MIFSFRSKNIRTACFLLGFLLLSSWAFSQESVFPIPDSVRRPERGEAPRLPQDIVIGELGQGTAPDGAYIFARNFISALIAGNENAPVFRDTSTFQIEMLMEEISGIRARSYRIGGGRAEIDGSISFLVRFLGQAESISGELFVRLTDIPGTGGRRWSLDDLILEESRSFTGIRDGFRFDFPPYERFF